MKVEVTVIAVRYSCNACEMLAETVKTVVYNVSFIVVQEQYFHMPRDGRGVCTVHHRTCT